MNGQRYESIRATAGAHPEAAATTRALGLEATARLAAASAGDAPGMEDVPGTEPARPPVSAHLDAGHAHGARFRRRAWRAAPKLSTMLDRLERLTCRDCEISVERMLNAIGRTSFAPLILIVGLLIMSPLGHVPGMPSTAAVLVGLSAAQIVMGRCHIWLPAWLLRRQVNRKLLQRAIRFLRPLARASEFVCRARMRWMTGNVGVRTVAGLCLAICVVMPPLEMVPMANSACGAVLALFGLALTTRDGVLMSVTLLGGVGALGWLAMG
ncbi:exopolysaccharide biosynthesis protein [Bordetella genomosp. 13]|uniref:exopolysaccharide biosynthesis protein n=1 Tax=Bordetella genomosp. 13 TaxID=463040 RepID=UPI0011A5939C|nr:exopolysaccharide biosynthesis protein [Bordetella genomosp. 13]